jgi:glucose/arabinose dehydrogenase
MVQRFALLSALVLATACARAYAQTDSERQPAVQNPPRPPAAPNPEAAGGSAASDGYAPIPQWLGQTRAPLPRHRPKYDVETVVAGIRGGFSFAFLPDGALLVTERPGRMRIAQNGELGEPISGLPEMWTTGPQGLLAVRPDRDFAENRIIYFSYTAPPAGPLPDPPPRLAGVQHVARARLSEDKRRLEDVQVLLNTEGIEGRLVQAADGTLFITSGIPAGVGINSADWPHPQRLDSLMGKVLRINPDGSIPQDNPFVGRSGARPEVYAYGLREDQGIAIDPATGKVWASENGPRGGDEVNVIEKGKNYGFPVISYGHEYTGQPINGGLTAKPGMEQPVYFWTPSIAPSGMDFYTGDLFPAWGGDLFVAAMAGRHLVRLVLDGHERVIAEERLLTDLNSRIRDVHSGPDGALYVLTDSPSNAQILRLVPAKH